MLNLLRITFTLAPKYFAQDVAATITPGLEGDALLGMSFLSRMDVRLYQGMMTIKGGE